jgi:hypothetical protein
MADRAMAGDAYSPAHLLLRLVWRQLRPILRFRKSECESEARAYKNQQTVTPHQSNLARCAAINAGVSG